jgi:hypothetical protein
VSARKVCEINTSDLIGILLDMIISLIAGDWYFIGHYYFLDCGDLIGTVLDVLFLSATSHSTILILPTFGH